MPGDPSLLGSCETPGLITLHCCPGPGTAELPPLLSPQSSWWDVPHSALLPTELRAQSSAVTAPLSDHFWVLNWNIPGAEAMLFAQMAALAQPWAETI